MNVVVLALALHTLRKASTLLWPCWPACVCACLCDMQRVHRVCADDSLTAEDITDAFEALLSSTRSATADTAAAASTTPAQGLIKALPAAVQHVQELFLMLQPSSKQQQQFAQAAGRLGGLAAGDVRVARFWLDYQVNEAAVCCTGSNTRLWL